MEHIITRRRGFRKLLAFLLCMASILGLLPAQAFAMSVGQTASSWLGDQYVGSDEPLPRPGTLHLSCLPCRRNHRRTHQFRGQCLPALYADGF